MKARQLSNFQDIYQIFKHHMLPGVSKNHIDFGCGNGEITSLIASLKPESSIIGYDPNNNNFDNIFDPRTRNNLSFIENKNNLKNLSFKSAGISFVFHENPGILSEIFPFLDYMGQACVVDYNMKGFSKRDFRKSFCLDNERKVLRKEGIEECYKKHTKFGVEDCIETGELAGFKTRYSHTLGPYFIWSGIKSQIAYSKPN